MTNVIRNPTAEATIATEASLPLLFFMLLAAYALDVPNNDHSYYNYGYNRRDSEERGRLA